MDIGRVRDKDSSKRLIDKQGTGTPSSRHRPSKSRIAAVHPTKMRPDLLQTTAKIQGGRKTEGGVVMPSRTAAAPFFYEVLLLRKMWCRLKCDHLAPHHNRDAVSMAPRLPPNPHSEYLYRETHQHQC